MEQFNDDALDRWNMDGGRVLETFEWPETPEDIVLEGCPFTDRQMAELFNAVRDAISGVKLLDLRNENDVKGEIFTRLRQRLTVTGGDKGWDSLFRRGSGFSGRYKGKQGAYSYNPRQWAFIEGMVSHMRQEFKRQDADESLARLRLMVAGLNASLGEMEQINRDGEKVAAGIEKVHAILNPTQEETMEAMAARARK